MKLLLLFITLLVLLIIHQIYYSITLTDINFLANQIRNQNSIFDYQTYQMLKNVDIPEKIIKNITKINDINRILQSLEITDPCNHKYINQIKFANKVIIIISGDNGSGKTNLSFQIYNYFQEQHACILATVDNYKQNYHEFLSHAKKNQANIFFPLERSGQLKKIIELHLHDFLLTQYTMLIIDTSGRVANNQNLQKEIIAAINTVKQFCAHNNVKCVTIYNVSGLKQITLPENIQIYEFLTISQINYKILSVKTITQILQKHHILFFSISNHFSDLHMYNNILLANMISKKISHTINSNVNKNNKS